MRDPQVHFGQVTDDDVDWRSVSDPGLDDDELLEETPDYVVAMLGFDPLEIEAEDAGFDPDEPRDKFGRWSPLEIYSAVREYGNFSYDLINGYLRGSSFGPKKSSSAEDDVKNTISALDAGYDSSVTKTVAEKQTVWRGVESKELNSKMRKVVGKVVRDKGFVSTSRRQKTAEKLTNGGTNRTTTLFEIELPKGTKYLQGRTDEQEMLLHRGSKFKVLSAKEGFGSNQWSDTLRVKMRLVNA